MSFFKKLIRWRKRTTKKSQGKEETHGGERWSTTDLTNMEDDAPLVQDARLSEGYLRFESRNRNSATVMGFFKKLMFWRKRRTIIILRKQVMREEEPWWMAEPRTPVHQEISDILDPSKSQYAGIAPETPIHKEAPFILEAQIHQEAPST